MEFQIDGQEELARFISVPQARKNWLFRQVGSNLVGQAGNEVEGSQQEPIPLGFLSGESQTLHSRHPAGHSLSHQQENTI